MLLAAIEGMQKGKQFAKSFYLSVFVAMSQQIKGSS